MHTCEQFERYLLNQFIVCPEITVRPSDTSALGELIVNQFISDDFIRTVAYIVGLGDEATGQVLVITAEPESAEATAQPENDAPARRPALKGNGKRGAATTDGADK